jgi:O-antigen/teichoic acid export membrane protein
MGMFFGPVAVGLYRFAARAMSTIFQISQFSLMSVSLPEFSRWQDNPVQLRTSVLSCVRLCGVLTIPALAGLATTSNLVMSLVGSKWADAGAGLKVLCLLGMFEGFSQFAGPLLQALGRPKLLAVIAWLQTALNAALLALASLLLRGATDRIVVLGVSVTHLVALFVVGIPLAMYSLRRFCQITIADVFKKLSPSLIAGTATALVALIPQYLGLLQGVRPIASLAILVAMSAPVGVAIVLALDPETRLMLGKMLPEFASKQP